MFLGQIFDVLRFEPIFTKNGPKIGHQNEDLKLTFYSFTKLSNVLRQLKKSTNVCLFFISCGDTAIHAEKSQIFRFRNFFLRKWLSNYEKRQKYVKNDMIHFQKKCLHEQHFFFTLY